MEFECFESEPYILFLTSRQASLLRKHMEYMKWDIRIFLRIPADKRQSVHNLLKEELKVKNDACSTESSHNKKTFLVNDLLFNEVSLYDEISKVCTELAPSLVNIDRVEAKKNFESKKVSVNNENGAATHDKLSNSCNNLGLERQRLLLLWTDMHRQETECNKIRKKDGDYQDNGAIGSERIDTGSCESNKEDDNDALYIAEPNRKDKNKHSNKLVDKYKQVHYDSDLEASPETVFALKHKTESQIKNTTSLDVSMKDRFEKCSDESDVGDNGQEGNERADEIDKETKTVSNRNWRKKMVQKKKPNGKLKSFRDRLLSLKCTVCGKVFASENFFSRHMKYQHSAEAEKKKVMIKQMKQEVNSVHVCPTCQKQFSDKYGLQAHMRNIHSTNENSFQCDLCGAVMKFKGSLVQHMKSVHTDQRPHQCSICNKHFKVLHQLKNHQRGHNPDHVETCTLCGKTVKKGQLSGHLKRHGEDRKHVCATCGKKFFEKQDLDRHLRIHSGEKPYKCSICQYACAIKGNLTKHIIHKHRKGLYNSESVSPVQPYFNSANRRKDINPELKKHMESKCKSDTHLPIEDQFTDTTGYIAEHAGSSYATSAQLVDGKRSNNHVEHPNSSVYSNSNLSESVNRSPYTTKSNNITDVDRCNTEHVVWNEAYSLAPVYHENDAHVLYNMRPVMRLGQSDDQIMSLSSASPVIEVTSQLSDGRRSLARETYTHPDSVRNRSDVAFPYNGHS